jgi:hypothetical protein
MCREKTGDMRTADLHMAQLGVPASGHSAGNLAASGYARKPLSYATVTSVTIKRLSMFNSYPP